MKAVPVMQQVYELKRELHIRPAVHVVEYSEASSPMMIGFLHPVLILPDENYDAENLFLYPETRTDPLEKKGCIYQAASCGGKCSALV